MFGFTKDVVGGVVDIAKEWIETDKESAEAKAVMVKALDPSGQMRAQISRDVIFMYKVYLFTALGLLSLQFFGAGDEANVKMVTDSLVELFLPITGMVSLIVSASFGVNTMNSFKGK